MTSLPIDQDALHFFDRADIVSQLNKVYQQVPSGDCEGSARCCSESVNMFYSEFLNVVKLLAQKGTLKQYTHKALSYYFTELVIVSVCPLLQEDNLCSCYDARPLPCRVFGHLSREEYEQNYQAVLKENQEAAIVLKEEYAIDVPQSLTEQKIPFCTSFSCETSFTAKDRDYLVDALFMVESQFLAEDLLEPEDFGLSLVQWFAYTLLGREQAQQLRIVISQEITNGGDSPTLESILEQYQKSDQF